MTERMSRLACRVGSSALCWLWLILTCWGQESFNMPWRTSCATSTCHGAIEGLGPAWNHAHSSWLLRDPHAGAGRRLRDETSRRMVERLSADAATDPDVFDNVLRARCVSCHSSATPEDCRPSGVLDDAFLNRGVHCESCHGSAANWLEPHLRVDWSGPERFETSTGMRDTESIQGRAKTCVRCHVGSRTEDGMIRDMNHDLIAAGHPALRFDLLLYSENLPKHWDANGAEEQEFSVSSTRLRQVGRAMTLSAAAMLASQRANDHLRDRTSVPWPELSDYDCFACHQSLSIREYLLPPRQADELKSPLHVSDGLPVWNAWHTVGNELEIRENRRALQALSPRNSDPLRLSGLAQQIAVRFGEKADQRMATTLSDDQMLQAARQSLQSIRDQLQRSAPYDWHQAAVQYLDLDAAARDLARSPQTASQGDSLWNALTSIEASLRFHPSGTGSPQTRWHSPAHFDPDAFRNSVLKWLDQWEASLPPSDRE